MPTAGSFQTVRSGSGRASRQASQEVEARGTFKPIKDELELGPMKPEKFDKAGDVTTDEETELPGTRRPRKGEGWWGYGHPIRAWKKSVQRDFVDGAGLCSPGRWPVQQRRLPAF